MKDIFRTESQRLLDAEISRLTLELSNTDPTEEDYIKIVNNVKALCEARDKKNPLQISADTLVAVGANILGLIIVLNFEKTSIVTSKAFGMLWRKS